MMVVDSTKLILGLTYIPEYINAFRENELISIIDNQPWITDLKRRVQHYGYRYDYKARNVTSELKLGELPNWLSDYCKELHSKSIFPRVPNQVIINEYQPGQGISSHIDCVPCFDKTIASLSLGSPCVMDFINTKTQEKVAVLLEPRSLMLLSGEARYNWQHGIMGRKTDIYNGKKFARSRRLSLTFRNVIII